MSGFLIDTNVVSEYARPTPDSRVLVWFERIDPASLYASVVPFGEVRVGIEDLPLGKRRNELERWLETGLPGWFESNMLPVTKPIAGRWGELTIRAKRLGTTLHTPDGLIAATAMEHNLTLVTRNVKDFAGLGVELFNPWVYQN